MSALLSNVGHKVWQRLVHESSAARYNARRLLVGLAARQGNDCHNCTNGKQHYQQRADDSQYELLLIGGVNARSAEYLTEPIRQSHSLTRR